MFLVKTCSTEVPEVTVLACLLLPRCRICLRSM